MDGIAQMVSTEQKLNSHLIGQCTQQYIVYTISM